MGGGPSKAERNRRRDRQNDINNLSNKYNHINSVSGDYRNKSNKVHADFIHLVKIINPDPLPKVSTGQVNSRLKRSNNQSYSGRGGRSGSGHQMSNDAIVREFVKVRDILLYLLKEIPKQYKLLDGLIDEQDILESDKTRFEYLLVSINTAISDIESYGDLQSSSRDFFSKEIQQLNTKIEKREKLNYDNYERRNEVMDRATKKLGSSYSNDYTNVRYQDQHTQFFVSLNAIFWYLYYLLILVIGYQLQYIQNNMPRQRKITWITVLAVYPFLYYAYDFMVQ